MLVAQVNIQSVFTSRSWFEWGVWPPWGRASTLKTIVTQIVSVMCCGDRVGVEPQTGSLHWKGDSGFPKGKICV